MIEKKGQFYVNNKNWGNSLGIDSSNLKNCIKEFNGRRLFRKPNKYNGVFGHHSFGFKESNLDFLKSFKTVKHIWFWDVKLEDIEGVYELTNLQSFGIR